LFADVFELAGISMKTPGLKDEDRAVVEVVIETPKESRVKFKHDPERGDYLADRVLPPGMRFPFNFGFIPNTRADDGDPADVILLLDEVIFPGCRVNCRVLGVLQAEQTEGGETKRNDRIIAVSVKDPRAPKAMENLPEEFASDIQRFFATYHAVEGTEFKIVGIGGIDKALQLVKRTSLD
jgi:inorganic pyrophosphatase